MIDDKKIEAAKEEIYEDRFLLNGEEIVFNNDEKEEMFYEGDIKQAIGLGAKWAINEFLNDLNELLHPASEVPRNDNGKILAFSKVNSNIKLYDMNAMLNETSCDTYQEMWEIRVRAYTFTDWVFVEELLDLIKKGGKINKTFVFDVMLNGRFVCTLKYKYCALFPIGFEDLYKFILKKRPTLKGKDFRISF